MAEDRGPQVAAVAILFLAITWVAVGLRYYVRLFIMKSFGADDFLSAVALALFTVYCAFVLKGVEYGTGQHFVDLPPGNIPIALKWWWCCELAYVACTAVVKASIGVFLLRICIKKTHTITIWTVISVVAVFTTYYFFLVVFQCQPVEYFWTRYLGAKGTCVGPNFITNSTYAHGAISAWADWTLGILPILLVWNLNMNPRTKVSVALILSLGAIGSTATIVRLPYVQQLGQGDFLYSTTDVAIWSTVEPGIGITAGAMATLRPLFRTFFSRSKLFGSTTHSGSSGFPTFRRPRARNYFRSGSEAKNDGVEELGLRSDIRNGIGVTTVIQSTNQPTHHDDEMKFPEKVHRSSSKKLLRKIVSETTFYRDDSSEDHE